jgi:hypothetical protein
MKAIVRTTKETTYTIEQNELENVLMEWLCISSHNNGIYFDWEPDYGGEIKVKITVRFISQEEEYPPKAAYKEK